MKVYVGVYVKMNVVLLLKMKLLEEDIESLMN